MTGNRLLVADDEPDVCAFIAQVAASCGYEVAVCSDPEALAEAFSALEATHIVLDLSMPGLDGIQVLRWLAELKTKAQVVIFSGASPKVLEAAARFGSESGLSIADTISKPVALADLRALLHRIRNDTDWLTLDALRDAIEGNQLFLDYQPKLSLPGRGLAGVEALLRWAHPTRGVIPPAEFLPLAEADPIIDDVTSFVVHAAIEQIAAWKSAGFECPVSINLSARNIGDLELADRLAAMCAEAGVQPDRLTLELTESAAMEGGPRSIDILTRLRLKGFQLSIDDFGTGFSSLVQLHRLPFCEMKIDRTFVKECDTNQDAVVIVRAMIDLAHNLNLTACAEGAENDAVVQLISDLHCDHVQGYAIARPMRADNVAPWTSALAAAAASPTPARSGASLPASLAAKRGSAA